MGLYNQSTGSRCHLIAVLGRQNGHSQHDRFHLFALIHVPIFHFDNRSIAVLQPADYKSTVGPLQHIQTITWSRVTD